MQTRILTAATITLLTYTVNTAALADVAEWIKTDTADYHVTFHYQTIIDRPAEDVYPYVVDMGSWIDFDFIHVSGPRSQEGEVFRLYEGQEFYFKTIKLIPNQLYVGVNLPSTFKGEESTGIAIVSLTELDGKTIVSATMSRQYKWIGEGPNPMREIRTSKEFRENTRIAWEEKFLPRLTELAEGHD